MNSRRSVFMKGNWAVALALLAVLVLSTVSPALAAAKVRVAKLTIGSQSGTLTYGAAGDVTYSVVVTSQAAGSGFVNLSVLGLPAGIGSFNPPNLSFTGAQSKSSILTIHSDGTLAAGATPFTVQAQAGNTKTVGGSLIIGKKSASVRANNLSKQYGTTLSFVGTEFTTSGFINGDAVSSVSLSSTGAASAATVANGPYPIVPSAALGSGLGNYNIQYLAGSLAVTAAPLNVTGVLGEDKTYDGLTTASVDASGAVLSGVIGSDVVTLNTGAATGTFLNPNTGLQTIQVSGLSISGAAASNYSVVQPTTSATINRATLTVTANPAFKVAGFPEPAYSFAYSGFVNGETAAAVGTAPTCGVAGSHDTAGTYDITCSGASAQNYTFSYVKGTLTVASADHTPTDISLSNSSVAERLAAGAIVGNLTATDEDSVLGETYKYSLLDASTCPDNAQFSIPGYSSGGPVPLQTAATFKYITKSSYTVCVRVDDGNGGTFDKNFPISILPSTMILPSQAALDGWVLESSETSGIGGTMNNAGTTLLIGDNKDNKQYRAILSFSTGALPDNAHIYGITLKFKRQQLTDANLFSLFQSLRVNVAKPSYGKPALQLTDFQQGVTAATGFANACSINPVADGNGWYSSFGTCPKALPFINLVGTTQFRLQFGLDDNNNHVANFLSIYSGNAVPLNRPQLVITYSVP